MTAEFKTPEFKLFMVELFFAYPDDTKQFSYSTRSLKNAVDILNYRPIRSRLLAGNRVFDIGFRIAKPLEIVSHKKRSPGKWNFDRRVAYKELTKKYTVTWACRSTAPIDQHIDH